ncbi:response regulator, partial [Cohnella nanjingensis]
MNAFKVLVVDDSPFMRKVMSDLIATDGAFRVVGTAADGAEALERTRELLPDIITMDLEMPAMNGLEALRRIMAERPTPVIMMSAVTDRGTRDTIKALQYGAIDFIRKPDGSVKLDIRQVGEQLLEKLHTASEMARLGGMRVLAPFQEAGGEPDEVDSREGEAAPQPEAEGGKELTALRESAAARDEDPTANESTLPPPDRKPAPPAPAKSAPAKSAPAKSAAKAQAAPREARPTAEPPART